MSASAPPPIDLRFRPPGIIDFTGIILAIVMDAAFPHACIHDRKLAPSVSDRDLVLRAEDVANRSEHFQVSAGMQKPITIGRTPRGNWEVVHVPTIAAKVPQKFSFYFIVGGYSSSFLLFALNPPLQVCYVCCGSVCHSASPPVVVLIENH
jgi:hypothetical protein